MLSLEDVFNKIEPTSLRRVLFRNHRHQVSGSPVLLLDALPDLGDGGLLLISSLLLPLVLLLDQPVQPSRPLSHAADVQAELSIDLLMSEG